MKCSMSDAFTEEQLNHEPKYKDEYYELNGDELDRMSYNK